MLANATHVDFRIPKSLFPPFTCVTFYSFAYRQDEIHGQSARDCLSHHAPGDFNRPVTTVSLSDHHGDIRDIQCYIY